MQEIDCLLDRHKGLMYKQLHKFHLINDPEAISIAYWALYKALATFKPSERTRISTYATCCIYNALGDYVRTLHRKRQIETISYNVLACEAHEFIDVLSSGASAEDICVEKELVMLTKEAISSIYDKLPSGAQKTIIKVFVNSEYTATATNIASETGVSQSYVSQVLSEFKHKLKKKMEAYYYA